MRIFIEIARVGISLAIIGLGVVGFRALGTGKTKPSKVPPADTTPLVETVDLNVHDGGLQIKVDGVAVPYREIQMAAEVSGRIAVKPDACRAGRYVEKGELLLQIDDQDYRLAVSSLQKELEQAQAKSWHSTPRSTIHRGWASALP